MKWFKDKFKSKKTKQREQDLMEDHRIGLIHKRTKLEEDIVLLEKRDESLFAEGKSSASKLVKRRVAAQLVQLRKDIVRSRQTISMFNRQIDVQATDLHNRQIIETGNAAMLPSADELTDHAVRAEEMMETLTANSDMVSDFETNSMSLSDEEAAIMAEFEQEDKEIAAEVDADLAEVDEECGYKHPASRGVDRDAVLWQRQAGSLEELRALRDGEPS